MFNQTEDLQLRDYLRPVLRRKWWILAVVLLLTAGSYAYYAHKPKVYEASTKILIEAAVNPLTPSSGDLTDRTVQDQAALLTSRDVASTVARQLGRPEEATSLAGSVTAQATGGSNFVVVTARRNGAKDAADVANAFARAFIQLRTDAARTTTQSAIDNARGQLAQIPNTAANQGDRTSLEDSIRQLRLTLAASSGSASQVDPALPPGSSIAPHPVRNALLVLIVALIGTVGLAYALEALDPRIRRLDEVSPLYGLPILASMPRSQEGKFRTPEGEAALSPVFKEPFRQLRSSLQLAALDRPFKRILVTSAVAGEGKTTVVRNLAIALREGGQRVAVVDCDLRRPALSQFFGRYSEPGLTNVLMGQQSMQDVVVDVPVSVVGLAALKQMQTVPAAGADNGSDTDAQPPATIRLLPSGPQPADPHAVLAAARTHSLLEELEHDHDVVIVDSPPILHVTDAVALATWVDAIIVVGRLGQATRVNARRLSDALERVPGAHSIGVVVNDVPTSEGAGYGYGYGYGE